MRRRGIGASVIGLLAAGLFSGGGAGRSAPADPEPLCLPGDTVRLRPSRDLYCLELVARPDIAGVTGMLELGRAPSPFDVAVTPTGNQRYDASLTVAGLADPSTLGPCTAYVAWVAPPSLEPTVKLGVITNGRVHLGEITFDKF